MCSSPGFEDSNRGSNPEKQDSNIAVCARARAARAVRASAGIIVLPPRATIAVALGGRQRVGARRAGAGQSAPPSSETRFPPSFLAPPSSPSPLALHPGHPSAPSLLAVGFCHLATPSPPSSFSHIPSPRLPSSPVLPPTPRPRRGEGAFRSSGTLTRGGAPSDFRPSVAVGIVFVPRRSARRPASAMSDPPKARPPVPSVPPPHAAPAEDPPVPDINDPPVPPPRARSRSPRGGFRGGAPAASSSDPQSSSAYEARLRLADVPTNFVDSKDWEAPFPRARGREG